jgi:hypothetical protein
MGETGQRGTQDGENMAVGLGSARMAESLPQRSLLFEGGTAAREGTQKATLRRLGTHHHSVRWCVGSMARPAASGEPRDYGRR